MTHVLDASQELTGISVSNGIGWIPDDRHCYYVDSATRRIDVFDPGVQGLPTQEFTG